MSNAEGSAASDMAGAADETEAERMELLALRRQLRERERRLHEREQHLQSKEAVIQVRLPLAATCHTKVMSQISSEDGAAACGIGAPSSKEWGQEVQSCHVP